VERRSLAVVGRMARVRPFMFATVVGIPLAALTATAAYVTTRPPQYLAEYQRGLELASHGRLPEAIEHLTDAVGADPTFAPARFELGRALVADGQLDLAISHFLDLVKSNRNAHSMAYIGFCYNLKRVHGAAIPWYEMAIDQGASSTAIFNNLAASYLTGQTHHPRSVWLDRADAYLQKALEEEPVSSCIRLNLLIAAETRASFDRTYNPFQVFNHAQVLLTSSPHDRFIELHVANWYGSVLTYLQHNSQTTPAPSTSDSEAKAHQQFAELYRKVGPMSAATALSDGSSPKLLSDTTRDSQVRRRFIEPTALD
jgi:tetratricopeptide (TPR) repeat protein